MYARCILSCHVALFARAWIETLSRPDKTWSCSVALFARAWIETFRALIIGVLFLSPSSRGRGLKQEWVGCCRGLLRVALFARAWIETGPSSRSHRRNFVALFARAWIETYHGVENIFGTKSPSSRGRGLKHDPLYDVELKRASPSSRGRGLKLSGLVGPRRGWSVALFARAWIETGTPRGEVF